MKLGDSSKHVTRKEAIRCGGVPMGAEGWGMEDSIQPSFPRKGSEATALPVIAQTPSLIKMKCLVHKRWFRLFPQIYWAQRSVVAWLSWKQLKMGIPRPREPPAGRHEVTSHSAPREREICLKPNCFQKAWPPVQLWGKKSIWRIWSGAGTTVVVEYELTTWTPVL